jgi:hypothetical protein
VAHVSRALKDFVLKNLQLGPSVSQIITKHHRICNILLRVVVA